MVQRQLQLQKRNSILLLGPRGCGKSFLIRQLFPETPSTLWIDLLLPEQEELYQSSPQHLKEEINTGRYKRVVIDEVQKAPKLLDIAQHLIETKSIQFIFTGSSARKLKRSAANLLAGRAFSYQLAPFSHTELGSLFNLQNALEFGLLPKLYFPFGGASKKTWSSIEKITYLQTYTRTYLKEEIQLEQIVRKIESFRNFLRVAAQMNGKIIDYSKIGRDVNIDHKTVAEYFTILEDTLVGFLLQPFHRSIRKRQGQKPKFYFFDPGVKRALDQTLTVPLLPQTSAYGDAFEHFLILEIRKKTQLQNPDIDLSFLRTTEGSQEVDLIVEKPGEPLILIEIKSTRQVKKEDIQKLSVFKKDFPKARFLILSQEAKPRRVDGIDILPWMQGVKEL